MRKIIGNQFKRPSGLLGRIISMKMKKFNMLAYSKIIDALNIKENDHLFEIGYGHGKGIKQIISNYNCKLTGIDFSELMFKEASAKNKKFIKQGKVDLYLGNFLTFDMPANKFDKIFCINVVYFWDDLLVPFSKIKEGLRKNGKFCFYMSHADLLNQLKFTKNDIFNKYSIEHVVEQLKSSGFSKVQYEFDNGYIVTCRK